MALIRWFTKSSIIIGLPKVSNVAYRDFSCCTVCLEARSLLSEHSLRTRELRKSLLLTGVCTYDLLPAPQTSLWWTGFLRGGEDVAQRSETMHLQSNERRKEMIRALAIMVSHSAAL